MLFDIFEKYFDYNNKKTRARIHIYLEKNDGLMIMIICIEINKICFILSKRHRVLSKAKCVPLNLKIPNNLLNLICYVQWMIQTKFDLPPTTFLCCDQKHFPSLRADVEIGCVVSFSHDCSRLHLIIAHDVMITEAKAIALKQTALRLQKSNFLHTHAPVLNRYFTFVRSHHHRFDHDFCVPKVFSSIKRFWNAIVGFMSIVNPVKHYTIQTFRYQRAFSWYSKNKLSKDTDLAVDISALQTTIYGHGKSE